jgi:hypothetical protein
MFCTTASFRSASLKICMWRWKGEGVVGEGVGVSYFRLPSFSSRKAAFGRLTVALTVAAATRCNLQIRCAALASRRCGKVGMEGPTGRPAGTAEQLRCVWAETVRVHSVMGVPSVVWRFLFQFPLSSSCLHLLTRLPVPSTFPSIHIFK